MRHLPFRLAELARLCFGSHMLASPLLVQRRHIDLQLVAAALCPGAGGGPHYEQPR
ncbi:conserved hypothetical protein [Frankia sp. AiPs1]